MDAGLGPEMLSFQLTPCLAIFRLPHLHSVVVSSARESGVSAYLVAATEGWAQTT